MGRAKSRSGLCCRRRSERGFLLRPVRVVAEQRMQIARNRGCEGCKIFAIGYIIQEECISTSGSDFSFRRMLSIDMDSLQVL